MKFKMKSIASIFLATLLLFGATSCGTKTDTPATTTPAKTETKAADTKATDTKEAAVEPKTEIGVPAVQKNIDVLSITFTGSPAAADEPSLVALEKLTNYKIKLDYLLNANLEDQLNTRMAAGNLPTIVTFSELKPSFINNARAGAFWELTDVYKNYPNLAEASEIVMNNIAIDGKNFGIYRARPLGRNGISYRKDWLENVGLAEPKTLEDLYQVMKAFKEKDPDKNGKDDTYGMTLSKWYGPLDQIAVAFGAPNKWGYDAENKLVPAFNTDAYMESMNYMKKLYDEGLINKDFAALESSDWQLDFKNSKSGVYIDVIDQSRRYQVYLTDEKKMPDGIVWGMGMVANNDGVKHVLPTTGHAGFLAITKNGAKTEEQMLDALNFIDLTNTPEAQNLLNYGTLGPDYTLNDKNEATVIIHEPNTREGLNQIMTNVVEKFFPLELNPINKMMADVREDNLNYLTIDPTAGYISDTYSDKGSKLDQMITDARFQYIVGQIDEAGWKSVVEKWYSQGGQTIVDEFTGMIK